jgi:hypothetical protein
MTHELTTIPSRCHMYEGPDHQPEELSPAWHRDNHRPLIAESLNNDRPGAVEHGARPIHDAQLSEKEEPAFLRNSKKIHWLDGRCGFPLHKLNYPLHVLHGYDFGKVSEATPERCCKSCYTKYQNA